MVFPLRVDLWRATVHAEAKPNLKRLEISARPDSNPHLHVLALKCLPDGVHRDLD